MVACICTMIFFSGHMLKVDEILFILVFVCNRGDTIQYRGGLWSRELGQASILLMFLTPRQALSSHPHRKMVWLYWLQDILFLGLSQILSWRLKVGGYACSWIFVTLAIVLLQGEGGMVSVESPRCIFLSGYAYSRMMLDSFFPLSPERETKINFDLITQVRLVCHLSATLMTWLDMQLAILLTWICLHFRFLSKCY